MDVETATATATEEYRTARLVALVEPSLADRLAALAERNDRSLSGELRHLVRQALGTKPRSGDS